VGWGGWVRTWGGVGTWGGWVGGVGWGGVPIDKLFLPSFFLFLGPHCGRCMGQFLSTETEWSRKLARVEPQLQTIAAFVARYGSGLDREWLIRTFSPSFTSQATYASEPHGPPFGPREVQVEPGLDFLDDAPRDDAVWVAMLPMLEEPERLQLFMEFASFSTQPFPRQPSVKENVGRVDIDEFSHLATIHWTCKISKIGSLSDSDMREFDVISVFSLTSGRWLSNVFSEGNARKTGARAEAARRQEAEQARRDIANRNYWRNEEIRAQAKGSSQLKYRMCGAVLISSGRPCNACGHHFYP
jgi:hypothetical protein